MNLINHIPNLNPEKFVKLGIRYLVRSGMLIKAKAEKNNLFDILEFIAFSVKPITRESRVALAQKIIFANLSKEQKDFLEFVLSMYIDTGDEELDQEKLPGLLELKYYSISDAADKLGNMTSIRNLFIDFQKHLYCNSILF